MLGKKIDKIMAYAAAVTAGNDYLAERAIAARARRVWTVPTVVDTANYAFNSRHVHDDKVRVGWIGTPSTWNECVAPFVPILTQIMVETGAQLRAVGAGHAALAIDDVKVLEWSEDAEVALIQGMDIGLMPLPDSPWMRGKCGYKLIQYMACGLPVIASPVGVNAQIVEHGVNGFLAETEDDWHVALKTLVDDAELRHRMGQAGRKKVELEYSLHVHAPRVIRILEEATLVR